MDSEIRREIVRQMTKRPAKISNFNHYHANYRNEKHQADLLQLPGARGYKYMLTNIDIFSRKAWCVALITKTVKDVLEAFKLIHETALPEQLRTDSGTEFRNKDFIAYCAEKKIKLTFGSPLNHRDNAIIERFNQTFERDLFQEMIARENKDWTEIASDVLIKYNDRLHSTTGMAPNRSYFENKTEEIKKKSKIDPYDKNYDVGDNVRFKIETGSKSDRIYNPKWSAISFTIAEKITPKDGGPLLYRIIDDENNIFDRTFYARELQKVDRKYSGIVIDNDTRKVSMNKEKIVNERAINTDAIYKRQSGKRVVRRNPKFAE